MSIAATGSEAIFSHLLRSCESREFPPASGSFEQWQRAYAAVVSAWEQPIDRAVAGGHAAGSIGFAFAAGIQAALRRLAPGIPCDGIVAVCITEEEGGHPRAIHTTIETDAAGRQVINGRKKWSTLAPHADLLLVAAVRGMRSDGRKDLVMAKVERGLTGVSVTTMPSTAFAPEIEHGVVVLDNVAVAGDALLPGDAYETYIKPFRTIEDTFVSAAVASMLLRIAAAGNWPDTMRGRILLVLHALRGIALADARDPAVHVLLDVALRELAVLAHPEGAEWQKVPAELRKSWQRDVALMDIAAGARRKRLERARENFR